MIRPRPLPALVLFVASTVTLALTTSSSARAEERDASSLEDLRDDAVESGDIDRDDFGHLLTNRRSTARRSGAGDLQDETWIGLAALGGRTPAGATQVGGMAVFGIAFDRIAAGRVHGADRPAGFALPPPGNAPTPSPAPGPAPAPAPGTAPAGIAALEKRPPLDGVLARAVVVAAWKTAGVGADDARVDEMVTRARASAALPETRLRVLKQVENGSQLDATVDESRYYDTIGAGLWLEARLTWRLDRLLYADDEPTLERVRLERQEARARLAAHVMDALVAWQRALFDLAEAPPTSREHVLADLRRVEHEAMLDVLTGGRFAALVRGR